jgi:predicted AAA+ superfamily ATPase
MLIKRSIEPELRTLLGEYPVVTVLGPRQSGKTTLATMALKGFAYVNLEEPEQRAFAKEDPKGFMVTVGRPVILDEIQRVPDLMSYIQVEVDETGENGRFVLTGSHQLQLREAISQSLAGRTALLNLLPLSLDELAASGKRPDTYCDAAFTGFLPRVWEPSQRPGPAYENYYRTYVERDVRQLIQLKDASLFEKMMKLLAGRTGQLFDATSLGNDVGVDAKTIRNWVSILEASFVVFKLPPYFENFGKRVIKSPKYYFTETGLLCHLLGIRDSGQISRDPLVGAIFENLVVMECVKALAHSGRNPEVYFFRDSKGNEVDLLVPVGRRFLAMEMKSAATFSMSQLKGLRRFQALTDRVKASALVYNGSPRTLGDETQVMAYSQVASWILDQENE